MRTHSRYSCWGEDEHRREAREDYQRGGRYGYDRDRYRNDFDECDRAYTREFDRLRRDEEYRQEEREREEQEMRCRARAKQEAWERAQAEAAYLYEQEQYDEPEPSPDEPERDEEPEA